MMSDTQRRKEHMSVVYKLWEGPWQEDAVMMGAGKKITYKPQGRKKD
jgi:hypothetical protein